MKKITLLILLFFMLNHVAQAQWVVQNLSGSRMNLAAAGGGDVAVFAGGIGLISVPPSAYDKLTFSTNAWTNGSINRGRNYLAGAASGTKLLFGGGADDWILSVFDDVDMYNGVTHAWSVGHLSVARARLAAAGTGSKVLFAGGAWLTNSISPKEYNDVDIYDTLTQAWTTATLSRPRYSLAGAGAGNKVLFAGGINIAGTVFKTVDIYDVTTNTWTIDSLSEARSNCTATSSGNRIFIAGGLKAGNKTSNRVDIYNVVTNTWTIDSLSKDRMDLSAASVDNFVFFAGGSDSAQSISYKTVDIYDVLNSTWTTSNLTNGRTGAAAASIGNLFIIAGGSNSTGTPLGTAEIYTVLPNGINSLTDNSPFNLFPNPVSENLTINLLHSISEGQMQISDAMGKVVYQQSLTKFDGPVRIAANAYKKGIYFVRISDGNKTTTQKLVVE